MAFDVSTAIGIENVAAACLAILKRKGFSFDEENQETEGTAVDLVSTMYPYELIGELRSRGYDLYRFKVDARQIDYATYTGFWAVPKGEEPKARDAVRTAIMSNPDTVEFADLDESEEEAGVEFRSMLPES